MASVLNALGANAPSGERNVVLAVLLGGVAVAAWGVLWVWSGSPYARYVDHGGWLDARALGELCRAIPGGTIVVPLVLYALAWVLMIAAMMLPTTYPLLGLFRAITRGRADGTRLVALVIAGFFVAWFAFGVVAHAADAGLAWIGARNSWLTLNGWAAGAAVLATAGLFQFSALKYRCLEQCHTPFAFVASRWHGRAPAREAFRLGIDHGIFCVGCCWALMLCMFAVGTASLGWMLVLAGLMAVEKNLPGGIRLRLPVGLGLIALAAGITAERL